MQASDKDWVQLQGKFLINGVVSKSFIFVEGPPPGTDILLNSLVVKHAQKNPSPSPPDTEVSILDNIYASHRYCLLIYIDEKQVLERPGNSYMQFYVLNISCGIKI